MSERSEWNQYLLSGTVMITINSRNIIDCNYCDVLNCQISLGTRSEATSAEEFKVYFAT